MALCVVPDRVSNVRGFSLSIGRGCRRRVRGGSGNSLPVDASIKTPLTDTSDDLLLNTPDE